MIDPKTVSEFTVFNIVGQKVLSQKNTAKTPELDTSILSKGVYMLQMIDKDGNITSSKFVKE